jgi:large subunit ribosomal protein L4
MIKLPVYNTEGKELEQLSVNESILGDNVRYPLLKQAVVMYHANKRVGTAASKSRSMVSGSTRKLYRQKGTGNARMGARRTCVRMGGGVAFAKRTKDFSKVMPRKQRRLARDSAVLGKILNQQIVVVDELSLAGPKTKIFAKVLNDLGIRRSCLVAIKELDEHIYKSARNIPQVSVASVTQLNAGDICAHEKLLFTKEAILSFLDRARN